MIHVIAVIGAMYGDEGKGLMTDYFAHKHKNSIVVRHNGGAQAGHTVQTPDGKRHVFSHFGSGTFVDTTTYLSEFFVCNPLLYVKEKQLLVGLGVDPTIIVHPNSLVTTPFDMVINMILEARRGGERHGSCGVGFGETIARNLAHDKLTVQNLRDLSRSELRDRLKTIQSEYVDERFNDQPLDRNTNSDASWMAILQSTELIDDWLDAVATFIDDITIDGYDCITNNTIIFEGAQGLMLDQQSPNFPHVTRSNTGVTNIISILRQMQQDNPEFTIGDFDVVYVSRAYTTRHGAGPLDFESELPYDITDTTNIPNINQGQMRFAPLLLDTLCRVTLQDFDQLDASDVDYGTEFNARAMMAFTCLDQVGPQGTFVGGGVVTVSDHVDFVGLLTESSKYTSFGPTRNDIVDGTGTE